MSRMEFRSWIRVPGLDIESDVAADLLDSLTELHGDLGPVLGGAENGVEVVLATDKDEPVEAAEEMYIAVSECLQAIGQPSLFPTHVEIELVDDVVPA